MARLKNNITLVFALCYLTFSASWAEVANRIPLARSLYEQLSPPSVTTADPLATPLKRDNDIQQRIKTLKTERDITRLKVREEERIRERNARIDAVIDFLISLYLEDWGEERARYVNSNLDHDRHSKALDKLNERIKNSGIPELKEQLSKLGSSRYAIISEMARDAVSLSKEMDLLDEKSPEYQRLFEERQKIYAKQNQFDEETSPLLKSIQEIETSFASAKIEIMSRKKKEEYRLGLRFETQMLNQLQSLDLEIISFPQFFLSRYFYRLGREKGYDNLRELFKKHQDLLKRILGFDYKTFQKTLVETMTFYVDERVGITIVDLPPNVLTELPQEFTISPSAYIESLPDIQRNYDDMVSNILGLREAPYDRHKVKDGGKYVFKRVDLNKVKTHDEEIREAERLKTEVANLGDPRFGVQEFLGAVFDKGNIYLVSRKIESNGNYYDLRFSLNFNREEINRRYPDLESSLNTFKSRLDPNTHYDLNDRNFLVKIGEGGRVGKIVLIDFETKPYSKTRRDMLTLVERNL